MTESHKENKNRLPFIMCKTLLAGTSCAKSVNHKQLQTGDEGM